MFIPQYIEDWKNPQVAILFGNALRTELSTSDVVLGHQMSHHSQDNHLASQSNAYK